jgi:hypothetical protein
MMTPEEHLEHHDDILKHLTAAILKIQEWTEEQRGFNASVTAAIERIDGHTAIVTHLLQRLEPPPSNGR